MLVYGNVSAEAASHIYALLGLIKLEHDVTILYAVESGSRAYGLHSEDSDYDVRFLFMRPIADYLTLEDRKNDTITFTRGDYDVSGWDIFKAMRLLRKFNPQLLEWFNSPIIYHDALDNYGAKHPYFREFANRYARTPQLFHHYIHMAEGNYRQYIKNPSEAGEFVKTKKYLYVLRPLLCLLYVAQHEKFPSLVFEDTWSVIRLPKAIEAEISAIVDAKRQGGEMGYAPANLVLNQWIEVTLERLLAHAGDWMPSNYNDTIPAEFAQWMLTTILRHHSQLILPDSPFPALVLPLQADAE